jgi:hypothetical protein
MTRTIKASYTQGLLFYDRFRVFRVFNDRFSRLQIARIRNNKRTKHPVEMTRHCFCGEDECVRTCANCGEECEKLHCPCRRVFYCNEACQLEDWERHKACCVLYSDHVSTEEITLSTRDMEVLCTPDPNKGCMRRIYRCNAPNVHVAIMEKRDCIDGDPFLIVREKRRSSAGYGSVSVFDVAKMSVLVYRYKLKHGHRVLEEVLRGLTCDRVYVHTDFDHDTAHSILDSVRRHRSEE